MFLTGGSGFVGSHILAALTTAGHGVRVLARDAKRVPASAGLEVVAGDVVANTGLVRGAEGAEAVIHLVGIIMEAGGATFERAHYEGTRNVMAAAKRQGVRRFVQMSALGARADGVSAYQATKWRAEEEVRQSGIEHVILRPSIIYGPRDRFVTQMVQVMNAAPLIRPGTDGIGSGLSTSRTWRSASCRRSRAQRPRTGPSNWLARRNSRWTRCYPRSLYALVCAKRLSTCHSGSCISMR